MCDRAGSEECSLADATDWVDVASGGGEKDLIDVAGCQI
jgi:hypothetical protein